jgi:hypothetical protein
VPREDTQFKKGEHRGRKLGMPNVQTVEIRRAIALAAHGLGGWQRLCEWAREEPENERIFWQSIYPRLLPHRIEGTGLHGEIELTISTREQMLDRLKAHHLPESLFGYDRPALDVEVKAIEAKPEPEGQD